MWLVCGNKREGRNSALGRVMRGLMRHRFRGNQCLKIPSNPEWCRDGRGTRGRPGSGRSAPPPGTAGSIPGGAGRIEGRLPFPPTPATPHFRLPNLFT